MSRHWHFSQPSACSENGYRFRMSNSPRFEFIRALCADLAEDEIADAEARFARLLDMLGAIAAREVAGEHRDTRFDDSASAP